MSTKTMKAMKEIPNFSQVISKGLTQLCNNDKEDAMATFKSIEDANEKLKVDISTSNPSYSPSSYVICVSKVDKRLKKGYTKGVAKITLDLWE